MSSVKKVFGACMKRHRIIAIVAILCSVAVITVGVILFLQWKWNNDRVNRILAKYAVDPTIVMDSMVNTNGTKYKFLNEDLTKLIKDNGDTVGYLNYSAKKISYPVVKFTDNSFYLEHDFEKKANSAGWIFGDCSCDFDGLSKNTVIYGHDRRDGTMFAALNSITNADMIPDDKRIIQFQSKSGNYIFEIYSVYTTNTKYAYNVTAFSDNAGFQKYIEYTEKMNSCTALKDSKVGVGDTLLTLSTCSSGVDTRRVVHAKLIAKM